jgi:hypothetical protein
MYGLQIADALITSNAIRQCGGREAFGPMRPFSHGGWATYAVGFSIYDLAGHSLLKRLFRKPAAPIEIVNAAQAASSAYGLDMDRRGWCR